MSKKNYQLQLKGYVGSYAFDSDYVGYVLEQNADNEVNVLIDSLGGSLSTALSIVAAFKNHGNVKVHFVGMNASAATIASMGASHVSIDSSAMYLVHKCSMEFFQWASANADKLQDIIDEAQQMKTDLEKMDANIAQMYANKCKKRPEDLLELMEKGGWLTAKEALEWGFVDEITDYEEDSAPVMKASVSAYMQENNIPLPAIEGQSETNSILKQIISLFKSRQTTDVKPKTPEPATVVKDPKDDKIAELTAKCEQQLKEIEALKKAPGDSTSQIVDEGTKHDDTAASDAENYFATQKRARELYDSLPR